MSKFWPTHVNNITRLSSEAVVITIDVPKDLDYFYDYLPGQYISVDLKIKNESVRRSYSICSAPYIRKLQVGVKQLPNGVFSTYVNNYLKVGDKINISSPNGRFFYDNTVRHDSVMAIAAGSGITPIISILKTVLHESSKTHITLIYGNKTPEKTMFYNELKTLEKKFSKQFTIHWVFSQKKLKNTLFGRINEDIIEYALNERPFNMSSFYLCGPESMILLTEKFLRKKGINEKRIHLELFKTSTKNQKLGNVIKKGALKIKCDNVLHTVELLPNKTILDSALDANIEVPYSCQGGVCSSCIGKIILGKAKMETNQILSDDEIEEGLVLTCQAYAESTNISVDFDDV